MKKRIFALILTLIMCFTMIPISDIQAAEGNEIYSQETTGDVSAEDQQVFSPWATNDLVVGDTYGIYPTTWYTKSMKQTITPSKLRALIAGVRFKVVTTDLLEEARDTKPSIKKNMTVEEVLNAFYTVLSNYNYPKSIGLEKKYTPVAFMEEYGIYTGKNGELGLKDKCSIEQACVIATRLVTYIYDALDVASKGFMWVATSGDNTVYMLGSVHMASYDIYPFSQKMLNAFQSADALAVELNMLDTNGALKIAQLGIYSDGTTLKDHVSEDTYNKTIELAAKFGYSEAQIAMLKPWYIYTMFSALTNTETGSTEELSTAAALGIDIKFIIDATLSGKPILEVEGYEYQAKVLDSFSDELEEYLLNGTINSVNSVLDGTYTQGDDFLDEILEYWHDGDVEAFREMTVQEADLPDQDDHISQEERKLVEEYQDKLMKQRDKGMAEYIDQLLKEEGSHTYFVVVGSAHFISDYSVLDMLEEKGYIIEQVK